MSEDKQSVNEKLKKLRHSAAHLLAAAVLDLYPGTKTTIGPATDQGFYYDFDFGQVKISEKDLLKIEKKMKQIAPTWNDFKGREVSPAEAKEHFKNNPYKLELIDEIEAAGQPVTFYQSGEFVDLCRGGHIDAPSKNLQHFKLLKVAGAYWRGDETKPMLTRIYGTAFFDKSSLDAYLTQREEAKKRDHRKLGRELDLFTFSDLVGAGLPLWTPKGTLLRNLLDDYVWQLRREKGYQKVTIPHITKKDLYETSGHWSKFKDDLFKITTREGHQFAMKPMNCPHHTQIYAHKQRSYRELPQRYAETTMVYRDEQTGELNGLSRVRSITQDDAHVFCREGQLEKEMLAIWDIIEKFYHACGFPKLKIRLSLHDPKHFDQYLGTKEQWLKAEEQLRQMIRQRVGDDFIEAQGEAAFYGPKIDFMAYDSLGREWQVATIQADRSMPESFDLSCINEAGTKERIVMIHAAIMGSIERFIAILIEHHAGKFPLWLAPVQVKVLPVSEKQLEYAHEVAAQLQKAQIRVEIDDRAERLSAKIRDAQLEKVPYMVIVGAQEVSAHKLAVRHRDKGDLGVSSLDALIKSDRWQVESR